MNPIFKAISLSLLLAAPIAAHAQEFHGDPAGYDRQYQSPDSEEQAAGAYGTGPGAVRFISGTWSTHVALERRLATFHGRAAAMLFSSAYAAMMGLIPPLVTEGRIGDDIIEGLERV